MKKNGRVALPDKAMKSQEKDAHVPLLWVQELVAVRRGKGWVLRRLPHGGGKHGRNATEADEGQRYATALRMLDAQHARARLRRCQQGSAAQISGSKGQAAWHGGRRESKRAIIRDSDFRHGAVRFVRGRGYLAVLQGIALWLTSTPLRARAIAQHPHRTHFFARQRSLPLGWSCAKRFREPCP